MKSSAYRGHKFPRDALMIQTTYLCRKQNSCRKQSGFFFSFSLTTIPLTIRFNVFNIEPSCGASWMQKLRPRLVKIQSNQRFSLSCLEEARIHPCMFCLLPEILPGRFMPCHSFNFFFYSPNLLQSESGVYHDSQ